MKIFDYLLKQPVLCNLPQLPFTRQKFAAFSSTTILEGASKGDRSNRSSR
jgi:hypothetical protein